MAKGNIVKLKKIRGKDKDGKEKVYLYVLVPITEEECNTIKRTKDLVDDVYFRLVGENILQQKEDVEVCIFIGEIEIFPSYRTLVYEFPRTKREILNKDREQFRDYTITIEKQKEILWYKTAPSNASTSWNTAKIKCASKYGMVLKIEQK